MTSKEAIKIIKYRTEDEPAIMGDDIYDMLDLIEKDLEVLEILKQYFTYWPVENSKGFVIECCSEPVIRVTGEEIENNYEFIQNDLKIKEWLVKDEIIN